MRRSLPSFEMLNSRNFRSSGRATALFASLTFSRSFLVRNRLIPTSANQNRCAQSRIPIDMIFQGWSISLFHASQQWATMSW